MTPEQRYAAVMTGGNNSPLLTDGYKFSMAQAGFPLRPETFYLSFRQGGPLFIPFDLVALVKALVPRKPTTKEAGFLAANGYALNAAMETALGGQLEVWAAPKGSWVGPREPVLRTSGPSFLVSWLEPLCISLQFALQVATAIQNGQTKFSATCKDEGELIEIVAAQLNIRVDIQIREAHYRQAIQDRLADLAQALKGDLGRAFEVGTRAMSCLAQHRVCLEECRKAGLYRTANVQLAFDLYMIPVGTSGHEHQQRWLDDLAGFRAMRDMRPEPPSYLFDTVDPETSGIPAAITAIVEDFNRRCSVRFDSGNQLRQLAIFIAARNKYNVRPFYIFEDGYDDARTREMEAACDVEDIPRNDRQYGYGGYLVDAASWQEFPRNKVQAIYKLCRTSNIDVMKSAGSKSSVPGLPITLVQVEDINDRLIGQEGEHVDGYVALAPSLKAPAPGGVARYSPFTAALITACTNRSRPS